MTEEQMRCLVEECGIDWQRGYVPLFDGDQTNRYAVLVEASVAAERRRCAEIAGDNYGWRGDNGEYEDNLGEAILRD